MKISRELVAENRERILGVAARLFRERGFEGVTVAEIMKAAGLTHGAFYGYFASKDELITAAFAHVLGNPGAATELSLIDYARLYLSQEQRDAIGDSCLFATLGTEAVRASAATRHAMTESFRRLITQFGRSVSGRTAADRRQAAMGSWSAMVGALLLSRIVDDPELSDEILAQTRAWIGA